VAYELVMRLGQPFDVLAGKKVVTLPPGGEIRVQFMDMDSAQRAYLYLSSHCEIRPVRDEGDGYVNPVVPGEVVREPLAVRLGPLGRAAQEFVAALPADTRKALGIIEDKEQMPGKDRMERLEAYADAGGLMGRTARREVEAKREAEDADDADGPAGDQQQ
jgi:hypothetical protein